MENSTAFDLNLAIQRWQNALAQSPALQSEHRDELESHLRDSVSELHAHGLSEEESFLVAVRRMGRPDALGEEFGKVNTVAIWRTRAVWMLAGMLFLTIGWDFLETVAAATAYVSSAFSSDGLLLGWLGGAARMAMFAGMAWMFWRLANGRCSGLGRFTQLLSRRPVLCVLMAVLGLGLLSFTRLAFQMLYIRNLAPVPLGQSYLIQRWFTASTPLIQIALIIALIAKLRSWRSGNRTGSRVATWMLILTVAIGLTLAPASAQSNAASPNSAPSEKQALVTLDHAMTLWRAGKKDEAAVQFLAVDFSKRPLFPSGSVLNFTEAQFIALPQAARDKMAKPMQDDLQTLKQIAAHVRAAGEAAKTAGDTTKATQCSTQLQKCGDAFDQPDSLALRKLVGKAFKKMAVTAPK